MVSVERGGDEPRVRALREARGLTQAQLITALIQRGAGSSRESLRVALSRWENGRTSPNREHRLLLASALQCDPAELGEPFLRHRSASAPENDQRLGHALAHPERADLVSIAHLREQVRLLDEKYVTTPASALIARAGWCLGQIEFLAARARRPDVQRDLFSAQAEAATLMGELEWDASYRRLQDAAAAHFARAVAAAQRRGDRAYEGLGLLRTSMVELYGRKNPTAGLETAEHAAETTQKTSHVLAGLSALHAAEARAMRRDRIGCEKMLRVGERHFGRVGTNDPAIHLFSIKHFARMAGSCYLFLDDGARATAFLEEAASLEPDGSKAHAIVLGNLSLARIGQGRFDEAAAALHRALDVIENNWGGGGMSVAHTAGRKLRPWQHVPAVADVSDRLLALMTGAR